MSRRLTLSTITLMATLCATAAWPAALLTGMTPIVSAGAVSSLLAKPGPGTAYSVVATNQTVTSGLLIGYNSPIIPADGALTPTLVIDCVVLPGSSTAAIDDEPGPGTNYTLGIVYIVSSSTSCYTKTTGTLTAFIKAKVQ